MADKKKSDWGRLMDGFGGTPREPGTSALGASPRDPPSFFALALVLPPGTVRCEEDAQALERWDVPSPQVANGRRKVPRRAICRLYATFRPAPR